MMKDSKTNLLSLQKSIDAQHIYIPSSASDWLIADLPISEELIRKLNFFKFFKLGDLNLIAYRKILKKFSKVKLNSSYLVIELYKFLNSPETFRSSEIPVNLEAEKTLTDNDATEIYSQQKLDVDKQISLLDEITDDSNDVLEILLEKTIFISPDIHEQTINISYISIRLGNVLQNLEIEKFGDLHESSFQQIFETRNCGRKTIFELRGLIESVHQKDSFEYFRSIENPKVSENTGIFIPVHIRDLPLHFLLETTRLKSLIRRLKVKTLGDLHELELKQIKKIKNVGSKTFSEFQELIENAQNAGFNNYLYQNQSDSFKHKVVKLLSHPIVIPDDIKDVQIKFVSFTSMLANNLQRLEIETLGDLGGFDFCSLKAASGFGNSSIFELWLFISRMQKGAGEGVDLRAEADFNFPVEVVSSGLPLNDLLTFINGYISELREREREVLLYRFGGTTDEKIWTLEEIGEKFQVTRERIRQIESRSFADLKDGLTEISEAVFTKLVDDCRASVCPLTPRFLVYLTDNDYKLFEYSPNFYLRLLEKLAPNDIQVFYKESQLSNSQLNKNALQTAQQIKTLLERKSGFLTLAEVFNELPVSENITMKSFFEAIQKNDFIVWQGDTADVLIISTDKNKLTMIEIARQVLQKSESALKPKEIINHAKEMFGSETDLPSLHSLANLPSYYAEFYLLDRKTIGLRQHFRLPAEKWADVREDCHKFLTEKNRPVSTTEILKENLFEWTQQTTASETTEILREDERFKDLGRFLFALAAWEIEEREPIKDLVIKVLREANQPLTATEIGNRVQKYRSAFTASLTNLLNKQEAVVRYEFGYYGLKEWNDDFRDFFATDSKLLVRSVKKAKETTFGDLCVEFGVSCESETAHKMWRTLRNSDKLRFDPIYKSPVTKIKYSFYELRKDNS